MSDLKLGLGMICKDEVEDIKRILSSYRDLFDEVQITITDESKREELEAVIKEYNGTPSFFEWKSRHRLFPFDEARNFNKSQFKGSDYYVRLDTDDSIQNSDQLRKVAKKAKDHGISVVLCFYDYARDEWGNTVAGHNRETIIQCSDNLFWNKRIHENILPKNEAIHSCVIDDNIRIFHHITDEKSANSQKRNLEYLIDEYNENKENTDPRTLAYLGRVFTGLGELDKAIHFLEKHIHSSGWDEDKYLSWCYLADIFRWKGDYQNSLSCCYEALSERTDYPDAYYKLMYAYHEMGKWEKAIEWGKIGATKKTPNTTMISDPSSHTWRPAITMALCHFKLGKFDEAKKFFDYAAKLAPGHEFITANKKLFDDAVLHKKYTENFAWMVNFLKDRDVEKLPNLVNSIPNELMEEPAIIGIRNHFLPSTQWKDGSVVFYCGQAWEEWSPKSVKSGIGGSEEAVINVAKELVKLGHEVTVYNSCGEAEGVHDGVRYVNYYKFNKKDEFDVLVAWRCSLFKFGVKAKKKIIWLHDVPEYILNEYDEKAFTDKAIVLSEYHKSLLAKKFPEEKIFVSSNGVDASQFTSEVERNPYRMIYASSYDRGLEHILNIWPEVKREVPQAELHVFYGWNTYDRMYEEGSVDGSFKKRLLPLLAQDGITEHGRVGHEELALEYLKSGIWAYPTHFPEISCIAAMKAQVAGCVPVCTGFAALNETVKAGLVIPGSANDKAVMEDFKKCLIELLKNPTEQEGFRELVLKHKDEFGWDKVAKQWSTELFTSMPPREFIDCRFKWIKDRCDLKDKIVDIGGNDGHTFEGWNRDNVTTVDIDEYEVPNFVRANACDVPLPDKSFDVVCLNEILEHIPDPVKALKEGKRLGRKKIIITVPNEWEWPKRYDPMMTIEEKEKKEGKSREVLALEGNTKVKDMYKMDNLEHLWHIRYYTKELLEEHLKEAGLNNFLITKLTLGDWAFYGAEVFLDE